jgi:hypothetical protein
LSTSATIRTSHCQSSQISFLRSDRLSRREALRRSLQRLPSVDARFRLPLSQDRANVRKCQNYADRSRAVSRTPLQIRLRLGPSEPGGAIHRPESTDSTSAAILRRNIPIGTAESRRMRAYPARKRPRRIRALRLRAPHYQGAGPRPMEASSSRGDAGRHVPGCAE